MAKVRRRDSEARAAQYLKGSEVKPLPVKFDPLTGRPYVDNNGYGGGMKFVEDRDWVVWREGEYAETMSPALFERQYVIIG